MRALPHPRLWRTACLSVCVAGLLTACNGDDGPQPIPVQVTLSGLDSGASLVLQDNGGDDLTMTASGTASFATPLKSGDAYAVTVKSPPSGEDCTVGNGTGTASGDAVKVTVSCVDVPTYTVGGNVTGLPAGSSLQLQDNGVDTLPVSAVGPFTFATGLRTGATYAVTVSTQPTDANCVVANGSGTIGTQNITNVAVTCTSTAVSSSTTSSTAFAVLATPTARIAFLPGTSSVVPFSIEGSAVAARAAPAGRAHAQAGVVPGVGLSFTPDSCTVDSAQLVVTCLSYDDTKLAFLDVSKFAGTLVAADITATEFDSGAPASSTSFSGGSCMLCGIVALTGQGQVVVSAHDGYRVYAYPAAGASSPLTPVNTYAVPITENFAADPVHMLIAASEYRAAGGSRALRLIDMVKGKTYTWVHGTDDCAPTDAAACGNDFRFEEVDSETFDLATGMLVMQSESGNSELMLDLGQASFDDVALTFDAPHQYADVTNPYGVEMSGALASPTHSYNFMVPEFSSGYVGMEALPAAGMGGTFPSFTADPVFVDLNAQSSIAPCSGFLASGGDPHSQGFTTSLAAADLGLFITGDRTCIVKVDLALLWAAPRSASQHDQVDPAFDLVANHVLTYVQVQ